jgi:hypothetical protein
MSMTVLFVLAILCSGCIKPTDRKMVSLVGPAGSFSGTHAPTSRFTDSGFAPSVVANNDRGVKLDPIGYVKFPKSGCIGKKTVEETAVHRRIDLHWRPDRRKIIQQAKSSVAPAASSQSGEDILHIEAKSGGKVMMHNNLQDLVESDDKELDDKLDKLSANVKELMKLMQHADDLRKNINQAVIGPRLLDYGA